VSRVAISSYAATPGGSSEPGAGWAFAWAAARHHDVWLFTLDRNRDHLDAALERDPVPGLHPVYVGPGARWALKPVGRAEYVAWQRAVGRVAVRLHADVRFDVAHHVVMSTDWLPCGLAALPDVPLVWGPIGGVPVAPLRLWPFLGARGAVEEVARVVTSAIGRQVIGRPIARRAAVVVAQNPQGARPWRRHPQVLVESNAALDVPGLRALAAEGASMLPPSGPRRRAVFVGRVVPWKGTRLAIEALARAEAADWELDVYGEGGDLDRCRRAVRRLGLEDRVRFHGAVARSVAVAAMATADALLLPTMHDSGPWTVAEAVTLGCPVVALDWSGPRLLATSPRDTLVAARGDVPGALASALAGLAGRADGSCRWSITRLPAVVDEWYRRAMATGVDASDAAARR
jgi:glycosyltransferase involved in cell wall biosynthesis